MNNEKQQAEQIFKSIDFNKVIDHPNILIAANFWEPERYQAACICYRIMRRIDDLIDDHKANHRTIASDQQEVFNVLVENWLAMFMNGDHADPDHADPDHAELMETVKRYRIPLWPFRDFARSMVFDIFNDTFPTLEDFMFYAQGASVAPASIFVHLSGLRNGSPGFQLPEFDVRDVATPCAIFSYLVHIIRDFQKDQQHNLNYFAGDMMEKHGLTVGCLRNMADGKPLTEGFRSMIREYLALADKFRQETSDMIQKISPLLSQRYRLSLEIVFDLYRMVYDRIDPDYGTFTTAELVPSPAEIRTLVEKVIQKFFS